MHKSQRLFAVFALIFAMLLSISACAEELSPTTAPSLSAPTETQTIPTEATIPVIATEPSLPPVTEPPVTEPPETMPPLPPAPELNAKSAFLWEMSRQQLLYYKGDLDARLYPASITKLFTSYVALQYLDPAAIITVGEELTLVQPGSSIAFLEQGHRISVEMLVQAMIMPSGNDAAHVISVAAGRAAAKKTGLAPADAVAYFVGVMNEWAQKLGFTGTHFTSPDGYHSDDHYTSLRDLIQICQLAMENPVIRKYAATPTTTVTIASGHQLWWYNTNAFIDPNSSFYSPEAVGLKTGYTGQAGWCLIGAFQKDGKTYIIGAFGCVDDYNRLNDVRNLYQYVTSE